MKNKTILIIAILILSITLLSGCQNKEAVDDTDDSIQTSTLSGDAFTSEDIAKNKLTVLNVWATWCPPCVAELPELQKVNEEFQEKGVEVVGVLQDGITEEGMEETSVIESANTLLEDAGASYRVVLPDGFLQTEFIDGMQYFPTTFFLDSNGTVVKSVTGANDYADWSEMINETLEELEN